MDTVFLESDRLYLRPHELEDADKVCQWLNDPEVRRLTGDIYPLARMVAREWVEKWIREKDEISLSIVTKEEKKFIGITAFLKRDPVNRHAELAIIIGEKEYWSKGYGTEVVKTLLEYGFNQLNLNMIYLGVIDLNERAKRAYEKAGFIQDGIQREFYYIEGEYRNLIMMSILKKEWNK